MIEAIRGKGVNRATVSCDACGRSEVVACGYIRGSTPGATVPNSGQIHTKMTGQGWVVNKGHLHCPACAARKRVLPPKDKQEAVAVTKDTVKEVRALDLEPTPKQERLIILALEDAYDDQNKRYRGSQTDKTVAEDLASGIRAGWVADLRTRYFGPSGGNEEIEAIRTESAALKADFDRQLQVLRDEYVLGLDALAKRLDAVCAAVGPKAGRGAA